MQTLPLLLYLWERDVDDDVFHRAKFSPCASACCALDTVAHKSAVVTCRLPAPEMAVLAETRYHARDTLCLPARPYSATSCLLCSASLRCSQVQPLLLGAGRVVLVGGFPREPSPRKVSRSFAPHARAACFCHVSHARRQWAVLRRRERARTLALCTGDSPRRR